MQPLYPFIAKYLGQPGVGDTPENRGQCVGLVEAWLDYNGQPHIWGNAAALLANADLAVYRVYLNAPTNLPTWGDIVCWDATWGAGAGHCGVVVAANVMHLAVFSANDPGGSPPIVKNYAYDHVQGWIRLPRSDA